MNFLLPHIRRMPDVIARAEFAENAAQKLGIESSLVRQELKNAAQHRLESVRAPQPKLSSLERVLLCALLLPEADSAHALAAETLAAHPAWYAELASAPAIEVLANGPVPDNPLEAAPDEASRLLLATAMQQGLGAEQEPQPAHASTRNETAHELVGRTLRTLHLQYLDRRSRELRTAIAEASRRGDDAMLMQLVREKQQIAQDLLRLERAMQRPA